jgi:protein-S-isoprenylcysteine O-methyltransferase Ste14
MSERPDNAGVRIPPPLFYAVAVILGLLLDGLHSLPISAVVGSGSIRTAAAWLVLALSLYLMSTAFRLFGRKHTSVVPIRPATVLVIEGPYRLTRNPMYVGLALLTTALSVFLDTWWPIILLVPVLAMVQWFVIAREESYLHRRFGAEYDAYVRQVRRWL